MIHIETDRMILRDHIQQDLLELHSLLSDETVMYYLPDIQTTTLEGSQEN